MCGELATLHLAPQSIAHEPASGARTLRIERSNQSNKRPTSSERRSRPPEGGGPEDALKKRAIRWVLGIPSNGEQRSVAPPTGTSEGKAMADKLALSASEGDAPSKHRQRLASRQRETSTPSSRHPTGTQARFSGLRACPADPDTLSNSDAMAWTAARLESKRRKSPEKASKQMREPRAGTPLPSPFPLLHQFCEKRLQECNKEDAGCGAARWEPFLSSCTTPVASTPGAEKRTLRLRTPREKEHSNGKHRLRTSCKESLWGDSVVGLLQVRSHCASCTEYYWLAFVVSRARNRSWKPVVQSQAGLGVKRHPHSHGELTRRGKQHPRAQLLEQVPLKNVRNQGYFTFAPFARPRGNQTTKSGLKCVRVAKHASAVAPSPQNLCDAPVRSTATPQLHLLDLRVDIGPSKSSSARAAMASFADASNVAFHARQVSHAVEGHWDRLAPAAHCSKLVHVAAMGGALQYRLLALALRCAPGGAQRLAQFVAFRVLCGQASASGEVSDNLDRCLAGRRY